MNRTFDKDDLELDDHNEIFHLEQAPSNLTSQTRPPAETNKLNNSLNMMKPGRQSDSMSEYFIENERIPDDLMLDDIHNLTDHTSNTPSRSAPLSLADSLGWLASSPMVRRALNPPQPKEQPEPDAAIREQVDATIRDILEVVTKKSDKNGKRILNMIVSKLNAKKKQQQQQQPQKKHFL